MGAREGARKLRAHHVVLDGEVMVDGAQARARFQRNIMLTVGGAVLCVALWLVHLAHHRRQRLLGPSTSERLTLILEDSTQPWTRRAEALDALERRNDSSLLWTLGRLCSLNTESSEVLEALGTALAQHVHRTRQEEPIAEELMYLQIPARQAFTAAMERLGRNGDAEEGG